MDIDALILKTEETPPAEHSGQPIVKVEEVAQVVLPLNGLKRKRSLRHKSEASPTPPSTNALSSPAPEDVVLSADRVPVDKPRLTISRHPVFVPIPGTGDPLLCNTDFVPMNRALNSVGFRYYPAGLAETGSIVAYRTIESRPTSVRVSWEDRSSYIRVSEDGLTLGGQGGFRSARCNVPIREGKWYMEVKIQKGGGDGQRRTGVKDGAHVRLGWGRREAVLNGPIGIDGYSYGIRDKTGEKVTLSRPRQYGKPFGTGDVVGLYISLPSRRPVDPDDENDPAHFRRQRIAIQSRGQEYWESLEIPQSREMIALMDNKIKQPDAKLSSSKSAAKKANAGNNKSTGPPPQPKESKQPMRPIPTLGNNSIISFFINGECQGIAFQDIYDFLQLRQEPKKEKPKKKDTIGQHAENPFDDGTLGYYPMFSLYNDARIRLNPGPNFDYPPPLDIDNLLTKSTDLQDRKDQSWKPLCDRYTEFMEEMWTLDDNEELNARVATEQMHQFELEEAAKQAEKDRKREEAATKRRARQASKRSKAETLSSITVTDGRFGPDVDEFLEHAAASSAAGSNDDIEHIFDSREGTPDAFLHMESFGHSARGEEGPPSVFDNTRGYDNDSGIDIEDEDAEGEEEAEGELEERDSPMWPSAVQVNVLADESTGLSSRRIDPSDV